MIKYLYLKISCIYFLISVKVYCEQKYLTHPMIIGIDSSNLDMNSPNQKLIFKFLSEAVEILSKIVNSIDGRKISLSQEIVIEKCKKYILVSNKEKLNSDLIIFPIYDKIKSNDFFQSFICEDNYSDKIPPNIVILYINNKFAIKSIINNPINEYKYKLKLFKYLLDCLGLNFILRYKTNQARDNFFESPKYLIENSFSYNSMVKYYKLNGRPLPLTNIDESGDFYLPFWPNNSIIKDFRNEYIDISYDMSETSFNLLNDLNYYKLSECDMIFDEKGICHRVDQKCINREEFDNNYYLSYGIYNSNIICYFSGKGNILNNQCGNKYGFLLNEIIDYSPLIFKKPVTYKKFDTYEIPELYYHNEQELKLLIPSKKCNPTIPRTIFFKKDYMPGFYNLIDIDLTEDNRKYFVTYYTHEELYLNYEYIILANFNGLLRSFLPFGNQNLIIDSFPEYIYKERGKGHKINKYQKISNFIGSNIYERKDLLYKQYKKQQLIFGEEYNYMQETYLYPEDKEKIIKYFSDYYYEDINNLWIVKTQKDNTDDEVHIFTSLENESGNFLISKYIHNPHLIKGCKYILRLYVLVSGLRPLRIYLNKEGLVRIATKKFTLDKKHLNDKFVHLINTGINILNKNNIYSNRFESKDVNKLNFSVYKEYLEKEDIDYLELREKIKDVVIKTVISGYEYLLWKLDEFYLSDRSFFNLFGYDVLIDDNYEPHLLEVNQRPDMHIYDNIDKIVKENLFLDTLNIIGLVPFSHDESQQPLDEEYISDDPVQEAVDFAFCELTRPKGDLELIFPKKNNIDKYKRFIKKKIPENDKFWGIIKDEEEDYLDG